MGKETVKYNDNSLPLVSIGLPVVKKEFLEQAIRCSLTQTYSNIEIIILNNAPDKDLGDDIETIVFSFENDKIKYYRNREQIPIIENWNKVLSLANGKYFSILCDDDRWDERFIETMVDLAIKYPQNSVFHSRIMIINESDEIIRVGPNLPEYEDVFDFIYNRLTGRREQFLSDFFVKTESIKQIDGFVNMPSAWGSDDLTWFYLAKENGVVALQEPYYYYRESNLSVTNKMLIGNKINTTGVYFEKIKNFVIELPVESNEILLLKKKMILDRWESCKKNRIKATRFEYLRKRKLHPMIYKLVWFFYKLKYR